MLCSDLGILCCCSLSQRCKAGALKLPILAAHVRYHQFCTICCITHIFSPLYIVFIFHPDKLAAHCDSSCKRGQTAERTGCTRAFLSVFVCWAILADFPTRPGKGFPVSCKLVSHILTDRRRQRRPWCSFTLHRHHLQRFLLSRPGLRHRISKPFPHPSWLLPALPDRPAHAYGRVPVFC